MTASPQNVSPDSIERAAALLKSGELVAFPTETVYGLGADADNPDATAKIFAAKGRPADHPLIVHLLHAEQICDWATEIPVEAWKLAAAFWPGPMTLILKRSSRAHDDVTGGLATVGLRVPSHPIARELLSKFGGAIAAPSANRFGHVSPTRAEHVQAEFGDAIPLILEGGDCQVGLESTIIDCSGDGFSILRPGGITRQEIEQVLHASVVDPSADSPACSGRLASHYAPNARVELFATEEALEERLSNLHQQNVLSKVVVLSCKPPSGASGWHWIPLPQEEAECARLLYASLRRIDELGADRALVFYPTSLMGLGPAIADRLQKAAGPR